MDLTRLEKKWFIMSFTLGLMVPFALLFLLSLGREWIFPALLPRRWTLEHWAGFFRGGTLRASLGLSLPLSVAVAMLSTALGFLTGRSVARSPHRRRLLLAAYAPYVLSPVIYAVLLQYFFIRLGLAGHVLGVGLGQFLLTYPFAVILFQSFWSRQAIDFEQVALTLGCSPGQAFRRVLLPMARPLLLVVFFQTFLISWFEFGLTSLLGVGKVKTLTIEVFNYIQEANSHYAALASLLLILPPVGMLWMNRRLVYLR